MRRIEFIILFLTGLGLYLIFDLLNFHSIFLVNFLKDVFVYRPFSFDFPANAIFSLYISLFVQGPIFLGFLFYIYDFLPWKFPARLVRIKPSRISRAYNLITLHLSFLLLHVLFLSACLIPFFLSEYQYCKINSSLEPMEWYYPVFVKAEANCKVTMIQFNSHLFEATTTTHYEVKRVLDLGTSIENWPRPMAFMPFKDRAQEASKIFDFLLLPIYTAAISLLVYFTTFTLSHLIPRFLFFICHINVLNIKAIEAKLKHADEHADEVALLLKSFENEEDDTLA